jgi:hypothetical protein
MHLIASYPITEQTLTPYVGRPVMGFTHHGDPFYGTLKSCSDGKIYLTPLQGAAASPAAVKSMKKSLSNHPKAKKNAGKPNKAKISFFGPPGFGFGGFGFGLGAGLGFALPLLTIAALFTAPFFI